MLDKFALTYSDDCVLERYHCYLTFDIILNGHRNTTNNNDNIFNNTTTTNKSMVTIFDGLSQDLKVYARKTIIQAILGNFIHIL